ncbi:uncharacterized protein EKO05_0002598 [Ascochyta rabiei]|uniref:uncharacterized protein n=1 Tax=Didymella rabiei TaxID=5454 RepID=UPI002206625E|nr:uncharacterized protein EKO05_0002598 [Ascochyta rabiei]UPX12020.1 hypothetical protein EKO05_0002598 [Ascochyta rabiei]
MAKRQRSTSESSDRNKNKKNNEPKYTTRQPVPRARDIQAPSILTSRQTVTPDGEAPMYFRNHVESRGPMAQIQWHSPTPDASIPLTEAEERVCVRKLITAFTNIQHANDSNGSKYKKRLDPMSDYYQPWAIEACAWDIVNEVKKIHTNGFQYDKIFDKEILRAMEQTKNLFFDERIIIICRMIEVPPHPPPMSHQLPLTDSTNTLQNSKFVGVNLLKDEKLITTIAAPFKLYASSLSNNVSNRRRNALLVAGREAGNAKESVEACVPPGSPSPEDAAAEAMLVLSSSAHLDTINRWR